MANTGAIYVRIAKQNAPRVLDATTFLESLECSKSVPYTGAFLLESLIGALPGYPPHSPWGIPEPFMGAFYLAIGTRPPPFWSPECLNLVPSMGAF